MDNQNANIKSQYGARYINLIELAKRLESYLCDLFIDVPRIDRISARAKSVDRYVAKAIKKDENGSPKYANPIFEIQDQIGARITVFYLSDVEKTRSVIERYLRFIEVIDKAPTLESEFGYFGLHFIAALPEDITLENAIEGQAPEFFELQIKTLFQHAWSEAHHDLGYKSVRDLTPSEVRKVAFTAAQAWGADIIFAELAKDLITNDN